MAKTAAERQKAYRERKKNDEAFKAKERERKRKERENNRNTQSKEEAERVRALGRERVRKWRLLKSANKVNDSALPFKTRQSFGKALKRAVKALPKSPIKKKAVIEKLAQSMSLLIRKPAPKNKISDATKDKVISFYSRDDVSRQAPGMKDTISIREGGVKRRVQKRNMSMSLLEAYRCFKEENPTLVIGKSKFADLRPPQVCLCSETPRNVCLCRYHENASLLLECVRRYVPRKVFQNTNEFVRSIVCSTDDPQCMLNNCEECRNAQLFQNSIVDHIPEQEKQLKTTWYAWETVGGVQIKVQKTGVLIDVLRLLTSSAPQFLKHCFIKRKQSAAFEEKKTTAQADGDSVVLQVDFAENFTAVYQDEIQSAHWNQRQMSIFTSVAWSDADPLSFVVVSDNLDHDKKAVATFLERVVRNIWQKHPHMRQLHIFSDGAASQFKNKFVWAFLSSCFQDTFPNLDIEWHFFATSHGKGAVDGVGGTVKRAISTAVLSRQAIVQTAADFARVAAQRCPNITIEEVTSEEIQAFTDTHKLQAMWEDVPTLHGTQGVHHVEVVSWGVIKHRMYSAAIPAHLHTLLTSTTRPSAVFSVCDIDKSRCPPPVSPVKKDGRPPSIKTGDCVLINFETNKSNRQFVGLVIQQDEKGAEIQFLRNNNKCGLVFVLPTKEDKSWISFDQIIKHLSPCVDNRGRYNFVKPVQAE